MRTSSIMLLLVGVLSACASTQPPAADPAAVPTASQTTPQADQAPMTPAMAELGLSGERYAALGDPQSPITMIEFSDFG